MCTMQETVMETSQREDRGKKVLRIGTDTCEKVKLSIGRSVDT